jgi:hypothetical protein
MRPWLSRTLYVAWAATFALAALCFAILIQGVIRDLRVGEPVIALDLRVPSDWRSQPFRVLGQGTYTLHLSSVNHDPKPVGRPLESALDVVVLDPDGRPVLQKSYPAGATGHRVPNNYGDVALETLTLDGWPLRSWQLRVRVASADPNFVTGQTHIALRKQRYDPGMGGLMNYAMIVPGVIFLVIAFVLTVPLARAGVRLPLIVTATAALAMLVVVR